MMDQTHVMYYYWQQPMANTYVNRASEFAHRTPLELTLTSAQYAVRHQGATQEAGSRRRHENNP